jgi:hypothetical protein
MSDLPQLPEDRFVHKGIEIRRYSEGGFVSVSDLWKSEGRPWAARPDLWLKQEENQRLVNDSSLRIGQPAWIALKGGSIQGTFAAPEVAAKYASSLSLECSDWLCGVLDVVAGPQKARRRSILLGDIPLEVFQLPSGKYRLSQTQIAEAIGKDEANVRDFLKSKSPEALPYKDFTAEKIPVERERTRFNSIPIDIALAYWTKESYVGNSIAIRFLAASAKEAIERRADKAFGIHRTEEEYNFRFKNAFEKLVGFFPEYASVVDISQGSGSLVLAEHDVLRKLKRKFSREMVQFSKQDFIRDFVLLGAETDDWHLTYQKGLSYPEGAANRNAYPDLITQPSECYVDGKIQRVVLLLQGVDTIVDENHIKDCFYLRDYIDVVKRQLQVDHALLFFVSPYGVTKYAAGCIKDSDDLRGCVGVITVKQLSRFLFEKASENKKDNIRVGRLRSRFKHLMDYKMLDELGELSQLPVQTKALPTLQLDLFAS